MARVRAVREHQNLYGEKPPKVVGDEYDVPDSQADALVAAKLVEIVGGEVDLPVEAAKPTKGRKR